MSCYGCKCDSCARNCELPSWLTTPGEITDPEMICFTCDECRWFDGDHSKRDRWRYECEGYQEARKHSELEALARRASFKVIVGGKSCGNCARTPNKTKK